MNSVMRVVLRVHNADELFGVAVALGYELTDTGVRSFM